VPPLGGAERKVADITIRESYAEPPYLSWFPDSRSLVVVDSAAANERDDLVVVSIETGDKRRLFSPASSPARTTPAVSPDGHSLVFAQSGELHVLFLDDKLAARSDARRLTERHFGGRQPAWTSDGDEIIVSAQGRLWRVNVADPRLRGELPFTGGGAFMPVVSRDRARTTSRLIYVRGGLDPNIWRVEMRAPGIGASPPVLAVASTLVDANPQFSPDGERIAFQSTRSGSLAIWIADHGGGNAWQLTSVKDGSSGSPRWSPDGKFIAFDSQHGGQWDIHVMSVSDGKPRQLTASNSDDIVPSFSHDGNWIYFASNRTGAFEIWKVPVSGGEAVRVTHNGGFVAFESPDGANLYYTQAQVGTSTLWRIPTAGGKPERVVDGVSKRAFAPTDAGIYYIEAEPQRATAPLTLGMIGRPIRNPVGRIRFLEFSSGQNTYVSELIEGISLGLAASRDGRTVLFTKTDSPTADLVMVENFR
jgi:Tol biopolymer transport system component